MLAKYVQPRVYVASPIFTPEQIETILKVEALLDNCDMVAYLPHRDGIILPPDSSRYNRQAVVLSNKRAIRQSDLVVAIMDDKDTGTIWEHGMANGLNIPVITFSPRTQRRNVMLSETVIAHVEDFDALRDVILGIKEYLRYGQDITPASEEEWAALMKHFMNTYFFKGEAQ